MQRPPARAGDLLPAVETPALCVDLAAFERNLERMAAGTRGTRHPLGVTVNERRTGDATPSHAAGKLRALTVRSGEAHCRRSRSRRGFA
jgi:hypothetical protein